MYNTWKYLLYILTSSFCSFPFIHALYNYFSLLKTANKQAFSPVHILLYFIVVLEVCLCLHAPLFTPACRYDDANILQRHSASSTFTYLCCIVAYKGQNVNWDIVTWFVTDFLWSFVDVHVCVMGCLCYFGRNLLNKLKGANKVSSKKNSPI